MEEPDNSRREPSQTGKKNVLVVGDWIIDENWIVTEEDSQTSAHIGKQLYRSKITNINAQLLSLCGAGSVARFLHGSPIDMEIYGFGLWNPKDTKLLAALFRSDCSVLNQTPLTLRGVHKIDVSKADSHPLCHAGNDCISKCNVGDKDCMRLYTLPEIEESSEKLVRDQDGTMRVLRVYGLSGSHSTSLLHRYDWRPQVKSPDNKRVKKSIQNMINHITPQVDVIVVVDHDKGGVTEDIVNTLMNECIDRYGKKAKNIRWYVRTKNPQAGWLKTVKEHEDINLKLIVTGPMLLNLEMDPWFLGSHLSIGALNWLCDQATEKLTRVHSDTPQYKYEDKENNPKQYAVVAFHEDNSLAAIVPKGLVAAELTPNISINNETNALQSPSGGLMNPETTLYITERYAKPLNYKVGRTSVLFSSLVASMEEKSNSPSEDVRLNSRAFKKALKLSHTWCNTIDKEFNKEIYSEDINTDLRLHYPQALNQTDLQGDFRIKNRTLKHEVEC